MHYCEAIDTPLKLLHVKNLSQFKPQKTQGIFPRNRLGDRWGDIWPRIKEYTERELTYSSDILNGTMGIFHAWKQSDSTTTQACLS
jgi:hypothetical protein